MGRTLQIADQPAEERSILDDVPNLVPELPCPDDLLDRDVSATRNDCASVDVTVAKSVRFCPADARETRVVFTARILDLHEPVAGDS